MLKLHVPRALIEAAPEEPAALDARMRDLRRRGLQVRAFYLFDCDCVADDPTHIVASEKTFRIRNAITGLQSVISRDISKSHRGDARATGDRGQVT